MIGVIVAIGSLALSMFGIWRKNIQQLQAITDKVETNEKNISINHDMIQKQMAENCATYRIELEQVKSDRAERVRAVYHEIEELKKLHSKDVIDLYGLFEKTMEKIEKQNMADHKEITGTLTSIQKELTDLGATFREYRKARNGHEKKE